MKKEEKDNEQDHEQDGTPRQEKMFIPYSNGAQNLRSSLMPVDDNLMDQILTVNDELLGKNKKPKTKQDGDIYRKKLKYGTPLGAVQRDMRNAGWTASEIATFGLGETRFAEASATTATATATTLCKTIFFFFSKISSFFAKF